MRLVNARTRERVYVGQVVRMGNQPVEYRIVGWAKPRWNSFGVIRVVPVASHEAAREVYPGNFGLAFL